MKEGSEALALIVIAFCVVLGLGYCWGRAVGENTCSALHDPWAAVPRGE